MVFENTSVSLEQIETADCTFKISTTIDKSELAPSIGAIGLLQPPILIEKNQVFTVVGGFRRIAACAKLKMSAIPARVLPPSCPRVTRVSIAIADNACQRSLNVVEQSRAYALIQRFSDQSISWVETARSVGLPASQAGMERILPVAYMKTALQENILSGNMSLPIALRINQLDKSDILALDHFFRKITCGLNVQRELLDCIEDISRRDDIAIAKLVSQANISGLLEDKSLSIPQKVQALRKLLKTERYPELSRAEAEYHRMLKSLKLNSRVQIHPPAFFEGKTYRLIMNIDSRKQLKSLQAELDKLARYPHLLPE